MYGLVFGMVVCSVFSGGSEAWLKDGSIVLRDTLPAYMAYAGNANPSTGFTVTPSSGTPARDILEWNIPCVAVRLPGA